MNRGDCAILRGLITELRAQIEGVEILVMSQFPTSSSYLLEEDVQGDPLAEWRKKAEKSRFLRRFGWLTKRAIPLLLALSEKFNLSWLVKVLPRPYRDTIKRMRGVDAVIQIGGSMFVDLYGLSHFELAFCAILSKKPFLMVGQSMGPFNSRVFQFLTRELIEGCKKTYLREEISRELLNKIGANSNRYTGGGDTAWLVRSNHVLSHAGSFYSEYFQGKRVVGITFRELAPFDRRLGITQAEYEQAFAEIIDSLVEKGIHVIALSTCTGMESYHKDDRMVALRVANKLLKPEGFTVAMDEFDDRQLGVILSKCELLIGTRLHSAIIAMNFGTPALVVNYEHKSAGIMEKLGLAECSYSIGDLMSGKLSNDVNKVLDSRIGELHEKMRAAVEVERAQCRQMISDVCVTIEA